MKRIIFVIISCLPVLGFGQNKLKGYTQIAPDFNISKSLGAGIGGSFLIGHMTGSNTSVGAGFDIIKYKNIDKSISSIYTDLRYYFGSGIKKPLPYFTLTPGYSFYKNNYKIFTGSSYNYVSYSGGFLIGAGIGCILYSNKKIAPFISVMYNKFPIKQTGENSEKYSVSYDVAKINIGMKF